jgi:hypothetical protein
MATRIRVQLNFVVAPDSVPEMLNDLNDAFEAATNAIWPGAKGAIEPDGKASFVFNPRAATTGKKMKGR